MKLENKVAVITGASSGMGRAIALLFALEGAKVVAVARRKEKLDDLVAEAAEKNGVVVAYQGDMAKQEDAEAIIDYAVKEFGRIDILVNNAGIIDNNKPVGECEDELYRRVMAINLDAPFLSTRKAVNYMLEQGNGNIINVASGAGLRGCRGGAAYTASKHALVGLTSNTAYMYAQKGIRCNAICPGGVATEIVTKGVGFENMSEFGAARCKFYNATVPRLGTPEEIAKVALFLASEDSSFVNGAAIAVDAGWVAG